MKKVCVFLAYVGVGLYPLISAASLQASSFCPEIECEEACEQQDVCDFKEIYCVKGNQLYLGSDIYYTERSKAGGTKQTGALYGVRAGYDYIKRYKFYLGAEALYAGGTLTGRSGKGNRLKSNYTDLYAEGRFGYTLQQKCDYRLAFTPFLGGGYYQEKNNFIRPSPISMHSKITFYYFTGGFLSQASPTPYLDVQLNFKVRYMWDPKNSINNDPEVDSCCMLIRNQRLQYRVDLPFIYHWSSCFLLSAGPFYDYRHYGGHVNFPFDFVETTVRNYGLSLKFIYNF